MNKIDEEEFSVEDLKDLKSLVCTVVFFTLMTIGLALLFVYALIKFL